MSQIHTRLIRVFACASSALVFFGGSPTGLAEFATSRAPHGSSSADLQLTPGGVHFLRAGAIAYTLRNFGPAPAQDVEFRTLAPRGTRFLSCGVGGSTYLQLRCETPPVHQSGEIICKLGTVESGQTINVVVTLLVEGGPGTRVDFEAAVTTTTPDPNPGDTAFAAYYVLPYPPIVETIRAVKEPGEAFRIEIRGERLDIGPQGFAFVGLGCDCEDWSQFKQVSPSLLILEGGRSLRSRFPKGAPVRICLERSDGATLYTSFTR
jgi:hypothetical protein